MVFIWVIECQIPLIRSYGSGSLARNIALVIHIVAIYFEIHQSMTKLYRADTNVERTDGRFDYYMPPFGGIKLPVRPFISITVA